MSKTRHSITAVRRGLLLAACAFSVAVGAQPRPNPGLERSMWYPDPAELKQLPAYCQGQFRKELLHVPGATISNCGGAMNHFCPALVIANRLSAHMLAPKQQRLQKAREGLHEIAYTKERMTPECPIRGDVAAAERRLKLYEQMAK